MLSVNIRHNRSWPQMGTDPASAMLATLGTQFDALWHMGKVLAGLAATCWLLAAVTGCASRNTAEATAPTEELAQAPMRPFDDAVTASALVFDPPAAEDELVLDLAREPRLPGAFIGYEEPTVSFYSVRVDDIQGAGWGWGWGWGDGYMRRAITSRTGGSYR